ncbi:transcriptional regulator, AlpA family [Bacteroidales bacterium 6E]|nr:transcriptional regulator, AlpA family [Bacteroidales bacterium 6E]
MVNLEIIDERLKNIESLLLTQKTVLNFDEAASYTGLSKSYLYKLSCSGGVPCYKPNGKTLWFNRSELDQWLMRNRKATNDELDTKAENFVSLNMPAL